MIGIHEEKELRISEFTKEYLPKLFYFCLKKTGDSFEAEDLTSDIALNILTALQGGTVPAHFPAWVWQIARNRYSVWASNKHRRTESVTGSDIGEYEIEDENADLTEHLIRKEDLALLRRELSFISSEYRNIVVAYYIDNRRIREIAEALRLPEGTVMSRLHRARKILKEGMHMAREFGKRSYKPEEISFVNNGSCGKLGQPWTILTHAMYKNIFLEAYGDPKTAEELALELGIALPYMEEELEFLTKETFLLKNGEKYETAFPIISREAQKKVHEKNVSVTAEITGCLTKMIDDFAAACAAHGISYFGEYQSYGDAKWTLLMRAFDILEAAERETKFPLTKRPNEGEWDIVGYQIVDFSEPAFVGQHGYYRPVPPTPPVDFAQYKYFYKNIQAKTPTTITGEEAYALKQVAEGKTAECEPVYIENLLKYGYIRKTDAGYEPTVVIFDKDIPQKAWEQFSDSEKSVITASVERIKALFRDTAACNRAVISEDLPPIFRNDEHMCADACANGGFQRGYVLEQAIADGWLRYDDSTSPVIGAYLYI